VNLMAGLYNRRVRGFRVINFAAVVLLIALMFGLYWAKTRASGDGAAISRIERQIGTEKRDIRSLEAQVAQMEQPGNIGRLSQDYLHLAPEKTGQEITPDRLAEVAAHPVTAKPAQASLAAAPAPTSATPASPAVR
jgi:hypothetical protein